MEKKIKWTKPELVDLGSARRMSFGETISLCYTGTGATACEHGNLPEVQPNILP